MAYGNSSEKRVPHIVELYGLPGAGKTTLTRELGPESGLATRDQVSAAWRALPFLRRAGFVVRALADLRWMATVVSLARQTPLTSKEGLGRLLRLTVTKPWLRSLDGKVLFDQGIMQRLWSIFYTEHVISPPHDALTSLLREYYRGLSVRIVVIEISPEAAARRVHQRDFGSSRLDELPEDIVLARLRSNLELTEAILRAARDAGLSVAALDGFASPPELAAQLDEILAGNAPVPAGAMAQSREALSTA